MKPKPAPHQIGLGSEHDGNQRQHLTVATALAHTHTHTHTDTHRHRHTQLALFHSPIPLLLYCKFNTVREQNDKNTQRSKCKVMETQICSINPYDYNFSLSD